MSAANEAAFTRLACELLSGKFEANPRAWANEACAVMASMHADDLFYRRAMRVIDRALRQLPGAQMALGQAVMQEPDWQQFMAEFEKRAKQ